MGRIAARRPVFLGVNVSTQLRALPRTTPTTPTTSWFTATKADGVFGTYSINTSGSQPFALKVTVPVQYGTLKWHIDCIFDLVKSWKYRYKPVLSMLWLPSHGFAMHLVPTCVYP